MLESRFASPARPIRIAIASILLFGLPLGAALASGRVADDSMRGDDPMQGNQAGQGDMQGMTGDDAAPAKRLTERERQFFESKIRPILDANCFSCHSATATKVRGGLLLDTREGVLAGGDTGPAIVPGKPDASPLIHAVRWKDDDFKMPPKKKLSDEAIRALEEWVAMGAPDPRVTTNEPTGTIDKEGPAVVGKTWDVEKGKDFWSFKSPTKPPVPAVEHREWPWTDVDRFVLAKMEEHGLAPVGDADKRAWLRRVTFDLTGLPPTPEEIASFDKDTSSDAYANVVDRLLASPAFGERWGRHWLDVARYAESSGKDNNVLYPHAWRYRDYVIASFNADKPYDEFLREQIAGDLLVAKDANDRAAKLEATAYLAIGAKGHNTQNPRQFAYDLVDEQIDAMSQGMIGLTVACARCHDHKFDPIPQKDYYALAGVFLSSSTQFGTYRSPGNRHSATLIALPKDAQVSEGPPMPPLRRSLIAKAKDRLSEESMAAEEAVEMAKKDGAPKDDTKNFKAQQTKAQTRTLETILERFDENGQPTEENRVTMGMLDGQRIVEASVLQRGEVDKPGDRVPRGVVQVVAGDWVSSMPSDGSGRLEVADWIADARNPLTARVWANRIWLHLFGKGIVPTPDNFGHSGVAPTNQALLDWLATRLVEGHWSTKALIRELVLSRTYRLASEYDKKNAEIDPDVTWLWRMPSRRLEAEAIRDAMLAVAGTLERDAPKGSVVNYVEGSMRGGENKVLSQLLNDDRPVRSVYLPLLRDRIPEPLAAFDFPDPAFVTGDRDETNVATQALYLMNDTEVMTIADAFADRVLALKGNDNERIGHAFELALGRKATAQEIAASRDFLKDFKDSLAKDAAPPKSNDKPANAAANGGRAGKRLRDRIAQLQAQSGNRKDPNARAAATQAALDREAWSAFCQSLFQTAEFRTLG
ncbi:MAG: PSD1 and planctomycete cytochrome C domain-containing protein [Phycisphaerales bacterium]